MQNWKTFLSGLALIGIWHSTSLADVSLFDSLGPANSFGAAATIIPRPHYDANFNTLYPAFATQFIPSQSGSANSIDIALRNQTGRLGDQMVLGAWFYADESDSLGLPIDGYFGVTQNYISGNTGQIKQAPFLFGLRPELIAGQKYWLFVTGYINSSPDSDMELLSSTTMFPTKHAKIQNFDGELTGISYLAGNQIAFRVNGEVTVPEPASVIVASGILLVFATMRFRIQR